MFEYDALEYAKIIGEPKNPKKPHSRIIDEVCEVDSASPREYVYYFDALAHTERIWTNAADGLTQQLVTPDTPTQLTFVDRATPEYYCKLTDLANAKERTLARKRVLINRALNGYETYYILQAIDGSAPAGNDESLNSGQDHFDFENLVNMIDKVIDYGDNYTLLAGTAVDKDIKLWNWFDNKNQSVLEAFKQLDVSVVRIPFDFRLDDSATDILASTTAYLVAKDTEMGKPCLFVRKQLDEIKGLPGVTADEGDGPERLVFVSSNPVSVGSGNTRHLAVGITGYENIVTAVTNEHGLAKFTRT